MKILLSLAFGLLSLASLQAKNMYVFSVTEKKTFTSQDRQTDRATLEQISRDVARCGAYELHWYDFSSRENFSSQVLEKTLKDFQPASQDDIVWFHFAGKGFAGNKKGWPTICLTEGNIPLKLVLAELRKKDLRTLLVTTDCDNLFPKRFFNFFKASSSAGPTDWPGSDNLTAKSVRATIIQRQSADCADHYYTLLFEAPQVRQIIVLSSASPGQKAHRSKNDHRSLWMDAMSRCMLNLGETASWKQLNAAVSTALSEETADQQLPVLNRQTITCCEN